VAEGMGSRPESLIGGGSFSSGGFDLVRFLVEGFGVDRVARVERGAGATQNLGPLGQGVVQLELGLRAPGRSAPHLLDQGVGSRSGRIVRRNLLELTDGIAVCPPRWSSSAWAMGSKPPLPPPAAELGKKRDQFV